jgi:hypothetical protein
VDDPKLIREHDVKVAENFRIIMYLLCKGFGCWCLGGR